MENLSRKLVFSLWWLLQEFIDTASFSPTIIYILVLLSALMSMFLNCKPMTIIVYQFCEL